MDYHIDAKNKVLGRVASDIALMLQGKKHASYARNRVSDDKVFVKNYKEIIGDRRKRTQKIYRHHTGYVGHLKELTYEQKFAKDPRTVLRRAVRKMLPRNFLEPEKVEESDLCGFGVIGTTYLKTHGHRKGISKKRNKARTGAGAAHASGSGICRVARMTGIGAAAAHPAHSRAAVRSARPLRTAAIMRRSVAERPPSRACGS